MVSREHAVTHHRVPIHAHESAGLPHAAAFDNMRQDRNNLLVRQLSPKERRALAFGKTCLAGPTIQDAPLPVATVTVADAQVAVAALAVIRALFVLTTERSQIVHGRPPWQHRMLKSPAQFLQNHCLGVQGQ
jgi:hypothetical protein